MSGAAPRSVAAGKLALLGTLYFSQGLPFGFFTQALPVLMRKHGYGLRAIGLASLLALPWALKFLWAPLADRFSFPGVGRRRSWILPAQALFTCMMDWSRPEASATDYTVQASAVVIATGLAASLSGFSAQALGYFDHFVAATVFAAAALLTVARLFPREGTLVASPGGERLPPRASSSPGSAVEEAIHAGV